MYLVILGVDSAWNAIVETFTEGGGFVSKHFGNPLERLETWSCLDMDDMTSPSKLSEVTCSSFHFIDRSVF